MSGSWKSDAIINLQYTLRGQQEVTLLGYGKTTSSTSGFYYVRNLSDTFRKTEIFLAKPICEVLYEFLETYIKRLCSFDKLQPRRVMKLSKAKMEAGEIPARSRHCEGGAFLEIPLGEVRSQPDA